MRKATTVTLKDIAREAGVDKTTASVVVNDTRSGTRVSLSTRTRIMEIAQRLGYRRNAAAWGLHRNRMDIIGVVAVNFGELDLYVLKLFNCILNQTIHSQQRITLLPITLGSRSVESQLIAYCDGRVDGIILLGPGEIDSDCLQSLDAHTPFVTINANGNFPTIADVAVDDEGGIYLATQHLIRQGHRRIAHLSGPESLRSAALREAGYCRALTESGIAIDPTLIIGPGDYTEESGRQRLSQLMERMQRWKPSQRPTALCCSNDAIAIGCLKELTARGYRIPEEISLTGFDDILPAQQTTPPLTTLKQPFLAMGVQAFGLLLEEIDFRLTGAKGKGMKHTMSPAELIIRGSTAPPQQ